MLTFGVYIYILMVNVTIYSIHRSYGYIQITPKKKRVISVLRSGQWGWRLLKALEFEFRWMRRVAKMGRDMTGRCYMGLFESGGYPLNHNFNQVLSFNTENDDNLHWNIWNCFFSLKLQTHPHCLEDHVLHFFVTINWCKCFLFRQIHLSEMILTIPSLKMLPWSSVHAFDKQTVSQA